jgi:hypothetical protein
MLKLQTHSGFHDLFWKKIGPAFSFIPEVKQYAYGQSKATRQYAPK